MSNPTQPASDELWEMVQTLSDHAQDLERRIEAERAKNAALNSENSGWLEIYRRHLSEIAALKAVILRLESQIQALQPKS